MYPLVASQNTPALPFFSSKGVPLAKTLICSTAAENNWGFPPFWEEGVLHKNALVHINESTQVFSAFFPSALEKRKLISRGEAGSERRPKRLGRFVSGASPEGYVGVFSRPQVQRWAEWLGKRAAGERLTLDLGWSPSGGVAGGRGTRMPSHRPQLSLGAMNCLLCEGVDRSSWTSPSDEKETKFILSSDRPAC